MNPKANFLLALLFAAPLSAADPSPEGADFFEKKVRPVLVEHCYSCHSAESSKVKGGLRVDSREALLAGGDTGPSFVPGQPEKSRMIEAVSYKNVDLQMPPKAKLSDAVLADLTAWVKMGAPWPGSGKPAEVAKESFDLRQRMARHWAWRPIQDQPVPVVKNKEWSADPVDRFLLTKMEEKGFSPAKNAAANVILRRLYFDIIGLPPTPADLTDFEKEYAASPQTAMEKVVDKLLASPQYGERWARHWLDLVRYAESRGHEFEPTIPNAYQYRDYVIRAMNADVPYNQFVTEHVAGDLMKKPRLNPQEKFNESVLGTGFWHLGEEVHSPVDIRADEADRFDNRIDVFSKTFLALTVSCARCHDHKFDAISAKDYYALYGFLRSSHYRQVRFDTVEKYKGVAKTFEEIREENRPRILKALVTTYRPGVDRLPDILRQAIISIRSAERSNDELVRKWVVHLSKAEKDPTDAFHLLSTLLDDKKPLNEIIARHATKVEAADLTRASKWGDAVVIADYTDRNTKPISDESAFGTKTRRTGEPVYGDSERRPITRFLTIGCAEIDTSFKGVGVKTEGQGDYGALGATPRYGNVLHTPGFTIGKGPVQMLVRGRGRHYVAVDGHIIIGGPLHGSLIKSFDTKGRWQWVNWEPGQYTGHRAHVEFWPTEGGDLAVAAIIQGGDPTVLKTYQEAIDCGASLNSLLKPKTASIEVLAEAYRQAFSRVLDAMMNDQLEDSALAALATWLVEHEDLLGEIDSEKITIASSRYFRDRMAPTLLASGKSRLAPAMIDGTAHNEHVFIRGSHKAPGEVVPRRFLEALAGDKGIDSKGSGRLELAEQMTNNALNPFITRVIVNRVWHHLFGRGIVASTDNFGELGERPTHPELLDFLAKRFADEGWSVKRLIRELVLTKAYRMSSQPDAVADAIDPENLLLHRTRLRRLEGEAIRDAMLAVSFRLNPKLYGPSVPIHLTPFLDGRGRPASGPIDGDGRRSLYLAVRRNFLSPMMLAFDTPSPFSTVGRRTVSNVPAQALILMNDPFVHLMAETWGKALAKQDNGQDELVSHMYRQAFSRPPTPDEAAGCREFLAQQAAAGKTREQAWAGLAHVLFNVKEFIFVE